MSDKPDTLYRRTLSGFEPATDPARAFWKSCKPGQLARLDGKRPRNPERHKLYWAMLTVAAENMPRFETAERLHYGVKQALRLGEFIPIRGGKETVFVPASTSFAMMSEHDFADFMDKVCGLLSESLGVHPVQLLEEAKAA